VLSLMTGVYSNFLSSRERGEGGRGGRGGEGGEKGLEVPAALLTFLLTLSEDVTVPLEGGGEKKRKGGGKRGSDSSLESFSLIFLESGNR